MLGSLVITTKTFGFSGTEWLRHITFRNSFVIRIHDQNDWRLNWDLEYHSCGNQSVDSLDQEYSNSCLSVEAQEGPDDGVDTPNWWRSRHALRRAGLPGSSKSSEDFSSDDFLPEPTATLHNLRERSTFQTIHKLAHKFYFQKLWKQIQSIFFYPENSHSISTHVIIQWIKRRPLSNRYFVWICCHC